MSTDEPILLSEAAVLLVEDSDDDAFLLKKKIDQSSGDALVEEIDVTRVGTLSAAVEACQERAFDAVFLDLGLPESHGIETVRRFTDHEFDLPIIVLTGLKDSQTALEAIQHGAQDYLVKGDLTPEAIVRAMRHGIERKKNERQVRRQRDQIEFFNSILRHDMLNGMQIIRSYSERLEADLDDEHQEMAEKVVDWSNNIVNLTEKIRDILDALTSGESSELKPVVVETVVSDVVPDVESVDDGVTVSTDCPADVAILADELFSDVLRNLLVNAVEHGGDQVEIGVTVERQADTVEIVVADDGPGVPEGKRDAVFQRGETTDPTSGSGFGLYFVDTMVNTYDGTVHVEDSDAGGARFVLRLPAADQFPHG